MIVPHNALAIKLISSSLLARTLWSQYGRQYKWDNAHRFIKFPTQFMELLGHTLQPLNWQILLQQCWIILFPEEDVVPELYSVNLFNQYAESEFANEMNASSLKNGFNLPHEPSFYHGNLPENMEIDVCIGKKLLALHSIETRLIKVRFSRLWNWQW